MEQSNPSLTVYLKRRVVPERRTPHHIRMDEEENIELQQAMVNELEEVLADYDSRFGDMVAVTTLINHAIKSAVFKYNPLIASELVSSSLSAWMSFARNATEEELKESYIVYNTDDEIDPELLFLDTDDLKPN